MPKRNQYKGITFQDDYTGTIEQFEKTFGDLHVFKKLQPAKRKAALIEAHNIALGKKAEKQEDPKAGK